MARSRFTILIVPNDSSELRKFKITSKIISYVLIVLAMVSAFTVGTVVHFVKIYRQAQRVEKVQQENALLRANLEESEAVTKKLNRKITALSRLSAKLKALAGLDHVAIQVDKPAVNTFGMGGVSFTQAPDPGQLKVLEQRAELVEQSLKGLQRYIEKEKPFSTPSIPPAAGFISSSFGVRVSPFTSLPDFHEGIDICNSYGTPVLATGNGTVIHAGPLGSFGRAIEIQHAHGITTLFGHLSKVLVQVGQDVTRGEQIGMMGNTGMSTGPHVHYEVRINEQPVNPKPYLARIGS
jgi:murein DD-endopeptidase MepM/ murein hydrolase activator NlpD